MTSNTNIEVEAKLQVSDDVLSDLRTSSSYFDGYTASTATTSEVTDVYYDSDDWALLRHGYALRIRETGSDHIVSLKTLLSERSDSLSERSEWEAHIVPQGRAPYRKSWPSSIRKRVTEIAPNRAWRPIVKIQQHRSKRMLALLDQPAPADPILECSLDTVAVFAPSTRDPQMPLTKFNELELELVTPDKQEALRHLVRRLKKLTGAKIQTSSKLERALLALCAAPPSTEPSVTSTLADVPITEFCRTIWRTQLTQINLMEHGVRADTDPEYIHDKRVATRRTRVATRLFGSYFAGKQIRKPAKTVRKLARRLGNVRDLDVALANLDTRQQSSEESTANSAIDDLSQSWRRQRGRMYTRLIDFLDSAEYAKFVSEFSEFCSTPGLGVKEPKDDIEAVTPTLTRHVLPGLIWQQFAHVRAYESSLSMPDEAPFATLHNLRIACKYLRYILEFAEPILEPKVKRHIKRIKHLQDILGVLNDTAVELNWLSELDQDSPELQSRITYLENEGARLRAQLPSAYQQIVDQSARKSLARILATL